MECAVSMPRLGFAQDFKTISWSKNVYILLDFLLSKIKNFSETPPLNKFGCRTTKSSIFFGKVSPLIKQKFNL